MTWNPRSQRPGWKTDPLLVQFYEYQQSHGITRRTAGDRCAHIGSMLKKPDNPLAALATGDPEDLVDLWYPQPRYSSCAQGDRRTSIRWFQEFLNAVAEHRGEGEMCRHQTWVDREGAM